VRLQIFILCVAVGAHELDRNDSINSRLTSQVLRVYSIISIAARIVSKDVVFDSFRAAIEILRKLNPYLGVSQADVVLQSSSGDYACHRRRLCTNACAGNDSLLEMRVSHGYRWSCNGCCLRQARGIVRPPSPSPGCLESPNSRAAALTEHPNGQQGLRTRWGGQRSPHRHFLRSIGPRDL
jgi:hypothetical protein